MPARSPATDLQVVEHPNNPLDGTEPFLPDVFISHSTTDTAFATLVREELTQRGLDVFLAPVSITPGQQWTPAIWGALRASPWVIYLASKVSVQSPYVQQEIGMALSQSKKLIPVVWDMKPSELPGWANRSQALDLTGVTTDAIRQRIGALAASIHESKQRGYLIGGALLFALFAISRSD